MNDLNNPGPPTKRMSAEKRKKQILTHAIQLISEQGFKTVSTRDIARAAQINEALIYRYFPTKDDLLRATLTEIISQQPVQSSAPIANREEFKRQLESFIDFFLNNNVRNPSFLRIILYAAMENYPLPDEFNIHKEGTFLYWLAQSIEKGKREWGYNPRIETEVFVSLFMGGLIYFNLQTSILKMFRDREISKIRESFIEAFLKSLDKESVGLPHSFLHQR